MNRLLSWILGREDAHLADEQIMADIESAASGALPASAIRHLRSCWQCLARRQQLQSITFQIVEYQQALLAPFLPPPPNAEERLLGALESEPAQPGWAVGHTLGQWLHLASSRGTLIATGYAVCIAAGFAVATRTHQASLVSATRFLQQAVASDHSLDQPRPGVASQRIHIQASGHTVERTLYRDLEGRRHLNISPQTAVADQVHAELAHAGVDWDAPLSAAAFATWHDTSAVTGDAVARSGDGLLTLTTTVTNSDVAEESLTVRQSDFHPVERTVQLRDAGTIEIAELDYSVSGWNATNEAAFTLATPRLPAKPLAIPLSYLPTAEELDEAELQARLAIGQDAVASSEALEFTRTPISIRIHAAVGTNQRRQEVLARLRAIPHVTASVVSIEELSASHATDESIVASVGGQSSAPGISPLTALFEEQSRSPKEAAAISRQLTATMFAVQQESAAITDLLERFGRVEQLTSAAQGALVQLLAEHRERLKDALSEEDQLVRPILGASSQKHDLPSGEQAAGQSALTEASARNRSLCEELVSGSPPSSRSAETIVADVLMSIEDIRQSLTSTRLTGERETSQKK